MGGVDARCLCACACACAVCVCVCVCAEGDSVTSNYTPNIYKHNYYNISIYNYSYTDSHQSHATSTN